VIIEILPDPGLDVESPAIHEALRRRLERDPVTNQAGDTAVPQIKVLCVGSPVYVELENRLLVWGKLIEPVEYLSLPVHPRHAAGDAGVALSGRREPD
jgi:hypothetical protein